MLGHTQGEQDVKMKTEMLAMLQKTRNPRSLEKWEQSLPPSRRETHPADALISDFWPPEPCGAACVLCKPSVCAALTQQPQQRSADGHAMLQLP